MGSTVAAPDRAGLPGRPRSRAPSSRAASSTRPSRWPSGSSAWPSTHRASAAGDGGGSGRCATWPRAAAPSCWPRRPSWPTPGLDRRHIVEDLLVGRRHRPRRGGGLPAVAGGMGRRGGPGGRGRPRRRGRRPGRPATPGPTPRPAASTWSWATRPSRASSGGTPPDGPTSWSSCAGGSARSVSPYVDTAALFLVAASRAWRPVGPWCSCCPNRCWPPATRRRPRAGRARHLRARRALVGRLPPVRRGGRRVRTRAAQGSGRTSGRCRRWTGPEVAPAPPVSIPTDDAGRGWPVGGAAGAHRRRRVPTILRRRPHPWRPRRGHRRLPRPVLRHRRPRRRRRCPTDWVAGSRRPGPARHRRSDRPAAVPLGDDVGPVRRTGLVGAVGRPRLAGRGRCPPGPMGERAARAEGGAGHPDARARGGGRRRRLVVAVGPDRRRRPATTPARRRRCGTSPPCWPRRPCRPGPSTVTGARRWPATPSSWPRPRCSRSRSRPSRRRGTRGAAAAERAQRAADAAMPSGWRAALIELGDGHDRGLRARRPSVLDWWLDRLPPWR